MHHLLAHRHHHHQNNDEPECIGQMDTNCQKQARLHWLSFHLVNDVLFLWTFYTLNPFSSMKPYSSFRVSCLFPYLCVWENGRNRRQTLNVFNIPVTHHKSVLRFLSLCSRSNWKKNTRRYRVDFKITVYCPAASAGKRLRHPKKKKSTHSWQQLHTTELQAQGQTHKQ